MGRNKSRKPGRTADGDTPRRGQRRSIRFDAVEIPEEDRKPKTDPDQPPSIHLRMLRFEDALVRLEAQLSAWQGQDRKEVLVVHGKGHNSPGGRSVLGPAVRDWCDRRNDIVASWREAPAKWGGSGAIVVVLA